MSHYPSLAARRADLAVHTVGLALAAVGAGILLEISLGAYIGHIIANAVYASCLIAMLSFSLAYNLNPRTFKPVLRRLDHVGIFLMIAGTYTPLTTAVLRGSWAWAMTVAVWTIAGLGILGKLFDLYLPDKIWTTIYISLGWLIIVAVAPISQNLTAIATILLIAGGLIYTIGAIFYISEKPAFWRSIWHAHVILAASCHWVAIFLCKIC